MIENLRWATCIWLLVVEILEKPTSRKQVCIFCTVSEYCEHMGQRFDIRVGVAGFHFENTYQKHSENNNNFVSKISPLAMLDVLNKCVFGRKYYFETTNISCLKQYSQPNTTVDHWSCRGCQPTFGIWGSI